MSHFPRELLHVSNGKELTQKNVRAWDCKSVIGVLLMKDTLAPQKRSLSFPRTPPSAIEERIPHQQQKRTIDAFLFQTEFN